MVPFLPIHEWQGVGCARYPGVYARVSAAYEWIQEQICTLSEQPPASCRFDNNNNNGEEEEERIRIDFQYNINPKDTSWKINNPTKKITQAFSSAGSVKLENILVSSYVTLEPGLYEFGMEGFGKSYILFLGKLYSCFFFQV